MTPITSGDTLDFTVVIRERSAADGWALHYRLIPQLTGVAIAFDSVPAPDGTSHRLQAAATTTATWAAGVYSWASWLTDVAAERFSVDGGITSILPDPAVIDAPQDFRSQAQIALADALAAMAAWKPTIHRYNIGGREMIFNLAADILPVVAFWKAAVQREARAKQLAMGMADPRKTFVRMGRV